MLKKTYIQCDTIEELKFSYIKLSNLRKSISSDFKNIKFKLNSWENAWKSINEIKAIINTEFIIYALTNLDNPARAKILGLTKVDIENDKEFNKWKNTLIKQIHTDTHNNSVINEKAFKKLNEIIKERELLWEK